MESLKKITLSIFVSMLLQTIAYAECKPSDDACWKKEYTQVCSYGLDDASLCKKLVNDDGTWAQPKWEVEQTLQDLAPNIKQIAQQYGVDPRAIGGAIFAENSINATQVDNLEDFLVKYKIAATGSVPIINRPFSFGLGQMYLAAAKTAEPMVAKAEGRTTLRSDEEIAQALEVPAESLQYIAGVLKIAQDDYAKVGIDISKDPGLLDTVYNLGKPDQLAAKSKASGNPPQLNFFGFFVDHYLPNLEKDISYNSKNQTPVTPQADRAPTSPTAPASPIAITSTQKRTATTQAITLYQSPPHCDNDASDKWSEYDKIGSFEAGTVVGTLKARAAYDVVGPGLGCNLTGNQEAWTLVRGDDGTTGWTPDATLTKSSTTVLQAACSNQDKTCQSKVQQSLGKRATIANDGTVSVKLATKSPTAKNVTWKTPIVNCDDSGGKLYAQTEYNGGTVTGSYKNTLNVDQAKNIQKQLLAFEAKMKSSLGLSDADLESNTNPYNAIIQGVIKPFIQNLDTCIGTDQKPSTNQCFMDITTLPAFDKINFAKEPSYQQFQAVENAVRIPFGMSPITAASSPGAKAQIDATMAARKKAALDQLAPCLTLDSSLTQSAAYIKKIVTAINTMDTTNYLYNSSDSALSGIITQCKFMDTYNQAQSSNCADCMSNALASEQVDNTSVAASTLKTMLQTSADKDQFLLDSLERSIDLTLIANQHYGNTLGDVVSCDGYDPFATATEIATLLKDPCVQTVYVPDPWLLKKFIGQEKKVILRTFLDNDNYAVQTTTTSCAASVGSK